MRSLALFARALVGRTVEVKPAPPGVTRCFAQDDALYLPDPFPPSGNDVAFAAVAHLAAHLRFGGPRLPRGRLKPIQVVLVSLLEDARVERLAAGELPGLARLWSSLHRAAPGDHPTFAALCARMARALADPAYDDPHPLVVKARRLLAEEPLDTDRCRRIGSWLGNDIGQMRLPFDPRTYQVDPCYRDDHRLLWEEPPAEGRPVQAEQAETLDRGSPTLPSDGARAPGRARPGDEAVASNGGIRYPEWDYRIGLDRPDFCTVREAAAAPAGVEPSLAGHEATLWHLDRLAPRLRLEAPSRRRRRREGDAVDLDAAIAAVVDRRAGRIPDDGVYVQATRRRQSLAVLLLLDLSASTAGQAAGTRVIDLARDAALLLGHLLDRTGALFAIHGFSSDGRHQIEYHRFKDLGDPWDSKARTRLAAITPRLSTRMGAALRHAGHCLAGVRRERRLLLLLTDGEPWDIDAPDPAYLLHDARHAVATLHRAGLHPFAVSLDREADRYIPRIFGNGRFVVVDRVSRLPDALSLVYARLARVPES